MQLDGTRALITGASSGIGKEFAVQLHREGANLVLVARRSNLLEDLCNDFNATRADSATFFAADLTAKVADEDLLGVSEVVDYLGSEPVDLLVNNAGCGTFGYFHEQDIEREIQMVNLNVEATLRLAHAVIPGMKERGSGAIINISSIAGFQPLPFMATYAATKAVNLSHSYALRHELAPFGIRVLAVCPGPVKTGFNEHAQVPDEAVNNMHDGIERVVAECVRALKANRSWLVPGWRAKLLALPCLLLPKNFTVWCTALNLRKVLSR